MYCVLRSIGYCLLPIAYCILPIANCIGEGESCMYLNTCWVQFLETGAAGKLFSSSCGKIVAGKKNSCGKLSHDYFPTKGGCNYIKDKC